MQRLEAFGQIAYRSWPLNTAKLYGYQWPNGWRASVLIDGKNSSIVTGFGFEDGPAALNLSGLDVARILAKLAALPPVYDDSLTLK